MISVKNVFDYLNELYPVSAACDFDNVGILIGDKDKSVKKAIVCLDCTLDTVSYAKENGFDLIVTHHPVIFSGLKSIIKGSVAYELIKSDISVISMHTNFDVAKDGVNDALCNALGFFNVSPFVCSDGFCIRSVKEHFKNADELAKHIKSKLGFSVRYNEKIDIDKILVCCGSGGDFLCDAISGGFDALVTADVKHNVFIDAQNNNIAVFDCGHYASENVAIRPLCEILSKKFPEISFTATDNTNLKYV